MRRIVPWLGYFALFVAASMSACKSEKALGPTIRTVDATAQLMGEDCTIDHWASDCYRALSGGEYDALYSNALSMAATWPAGDDCNTLGNYILSNVADARTLYYPISSNGSWATGDSHAPGYSFGRAHAAATVWDGTQFGPRPIDGNNGMLVSWVHEFAHEGLGLPGGASGSDPAGALAARCLGYTYP